MRKYMRFLLSVICICVFAAVPAFADEPISIASKHYVDSGFAQKASTAIVAAFQNRPDGFATAVQGDLAESAVQPRELASVAFSGDYNDLINKPDTNPASLYEIRSNSISGAVTGNSFYIEMDGFIFMAMKQGTANSWAVRIVNNSSETRSISTSWLQLYGGAQSINKENTALAKGAEHNPDAEVGDLGTGKQDTGITHLFDHTNDHLYRWTVTVFVGRAIMVVERLH